ncbi:hypothetical protein [Spongiactinospora sp. TRM90649]|uniref:hypothetical protein n=1 Tax=Spongiactinospora sp. TRM90649 TaxID=3031114 RepID=UPI0023F8EC1D|nr:hypothetical protein [Spongiactinospora sp. TRM90649]MDF5752269.1 hypothetical protein [Spongiactinospora sp. TRM90649]
MSFDEIFRGLPPGAGAQAAGLTLGYGGAPARSVSARHGPTRLRCASLLKPLYAWAAHPSLGTGPFPEERWNATAEPAVRVSDNTATLDLWYSAGPRVILDRLAGRTGVNWVPSSADPHWFGGVEVTAEEVVTAYGALALAEIGSDLAATALLTWMRGAEQGFGVPDVVAEAVGAAPGAVAVKCGWAGFADEIALRTHAVAVARSGPRAVVVAALTAVPYIDGRDAYAEGVATGDEMLDVHEAVAGGVLRALAGRTLAELGLR